MKAPDFALQDQDGKTHTLNEYRGKWVIIYFYPKDDTPGCTKEACGFRDSLAKLTQMNTVILGVSKDTVKSHKKFADKFHLNFPLLADPEKNVIKAYNAWKEKQFMGRPGVARITHIISPEGEIVKTYKKVDPIVHANEIITDIITMAK